MHLRRHAALPVALVAALVLGACSAGGLPSGHHGSSGPVVPSGPVVSAGGSVATDASVPPTVPGITGTHDGDVSTPPPEPIVRKIGKSAEYAGFEITVKTLTYTPGHGAMPGTVELGLLLHNLADRTGSLAFGAAFDLASGDHHYPDDHSAELPTVPGGAQNETTLTFRVDEAFAADNAVLTIGAGPLVQSVIPLGSAGELVANAPSKVDISGSAASGPLTLHVNGATLRTDLLKVFKQGKDDERFLLLDFDVSNHSSSEYPYGDAVTGYSQFALLEPNGDTIGAYGYDDWYGGAPTTTVRPGATAHDLLVVFVIDAPASGKYTLEFTATKDDGSGNASTGRWSFTLP